MADTQKNDWEDAEKFFIHSTFHLLFYNRRFLKEFNLKLAEHVRDNITDLIADTTYQSYFTNGKFKRNTDYRWVKDGIFSRENYRCPLCSCDLSVRNKSKKPNLSILFQFIISVVMTLQIFNTFAMLTMAKNVPVMIRIMNMYLFGTLKSRCQ